MRAAQFVKGKIWDEEKQDSYEQSFESPNIETFLPYEKYAKLRTQRYITKPKQFYYKDEHVFAMIEVKESDHVDSAGRSGLVVHGYLVDITPDSRLNGFPIKLNESAMLEEVLADKWRLKMPFFPELTKPLVIPPIEWEAPP